MKTSLLCLAFSFFSFFASAQTCAPDTTDFNLFSITQDSIPCIIQSEPYYFTSYFYVPDTFFGYQVFWARITGISGLPSGITYTCSPQNCEIQADEHGAICISGTTTDTAGFYNVTFSGLISASAGTFSLSQIEGFGGPPTTYTFLVKNAGESCVETPSGIATQNRTVALEVYPNPGNGIFYVDWKNSSAEVELVQVTDLTGKSILMEKYAGSNKKNMTLDLSGYAKGIYLVRAKSSAGDVVKKIALM